MGSSPTLDHPSPSWDRDGSSTHPARQQRTADAQPTTRDLEQAFDRLNPDYGVPADPHNPYGHQALRDREAALALGTRVAVASSRENDPNPVMWLAGQDYRAADATRTARLELVRQPTWSRTARPRTLTPPPATPVRRSHDGSRQPDHHRRQPGRGPPSSASPTPAPRSPTCASP